MDKKYQIFISSTFTDLEEERDKIIKSILELYHIPIGMEMFSAQDEDQWEIIRRTIEISDYYILILGLRYGSKTSDNISFTQKEYEYALKKKIPILAFVLNENVSLAQNKRDNNLDEINAFRKLVLNNNKMSQFWTNPDDLARQVSTSLMKQIMQKPGIGWTRGDNKAILDELAKELSELSKENRALRDENEELKSEVTLRKPNIKLTINKNNTINVKKNILYNVDKVFRPKNIDFNLIETHLKKHITKDEVDKYNLDIPSQNIIDKYNLDYDKYYKIKYFSSNLSLSVHNDGTIKANNIYIDIQFPDSLLVLKNDDDEEEPTNPIPYNILDRAENRHNELTFIESLKKGDNIFSQPFLNTVKLPMFKIPTPGKWVDIEKNEMTIKLNSLIHTRETIFNDEYQIIPLTKGIHKIQISIICEEYNIVDEQIIELNVK